MWALGTLLGRGLAVGPGVRRGAGGWAGGRAGGCPRAERSGGPAAERYGRWQCRPDFMNGGGGGEADGCGEVVMEKRGGD